MAAKLADTELFLFCDVLKKMIKKNKTFYSGFKDNISGADLAAMQSISKLNKGFIFLLCVIGIFSKYAWVAPLKDKKGVTIVSTFQKILDKSTRKRNMKQVDKVSKFCKSFFKKWLKIMILKCI